MTDGPRELVSLPSATSVRNSAGFMPGSGFVIDRMVDVRKQRSLRRTTTLISVNTSLWRT